MTPVEKAVIVPQCERRFFFFSYSLMLSFSFFLFYFPTISVRVREGEGEGEVLGKEVSVNWLMCSIQRTLYTGSIKQESALYAGTIVPLRTTKKASNKPPLPCKKKKKHHSSREQSRIGEITCATSRRF